ncbi:MAG TPA: carboxypeptidase-like regulatory domain-containing protein [Nitrospira sp.]|nr:carboxypeptidase-like regulatory domain-containing protein [Nitrospira sp.]
MKKWLPVLILSAGLGSSFSFAQYGIVDCIEQKKLIVPRVQGQVFDPTGIALPDAAISLWPDGRPIVQLKSDAKGQFYFKVESGHYILKATYPGFAITTAELEVGKDVVSILHPEALRVILALPGLNCPWVTTSNKEFKELVRKHATQK